MQTDRRTRTGSRTVAAVVMAVIGAGILAVSLTEVVQGDSRISALRAHGRRVPGDASIARACSTGRGTTCSTTNVWLTFRDAQGLDEYVAEPRLAHTLYVPSGPAGDDGRVHTTVVYDPADPDDAQAAGALRWGPWDLIEHRWLTFTVGLGLAVAGSGALVADRIRG
ncbi:DUF3592 domain-containing protein [Streptomyces broussonetiae]|uniref:DUF3592 domain-containing protein n=1 Tax=Streptomyces broussonetiae TaxID=2686304 RepID=A0A6I6N4P2_9ACTN|nr:DUF3592 domain-containing protein [Streptomyces broussonetiae]QHA08128.1 hypothetical protein GQF42_37025 [Streptomyces broussonetiae]